PAKKLAGVGEAIRTHQAKDEPVLMEAVLLHDADILEQLGAIGILRAVAKVGRDTRYETFSSVIPVLRNALEYLPGQLRLGTSKDSAASRVELVRSFISALEEEAASQLQ